MVPGMFFMFRSIVDSPPDKVVISPVFTVCEYAGNSITVKVYAKSNFGQMNLNIFS